MPVAAKAASPSAMISVPELMPIKPPIFRMPYKPGNRAKEMLEVTRPNAYQRGYGRRWSRLRSMFLAQHPLCMAILSDGRACARAASEVDHKERHQGDQQLFWDWNNLQSLCHSCHSTKTAKEVGFHG